MWFNQLLFCANIYVKVAVSTVYHVLKRFNQLGTSEDLGAQERRNPKRSAGQMDKT